MSKFIVVTDLDKRSEPEILERAQLMATGIESNADALPKVPATPESLRENVAIVNDCRISAGELRAKASELEQKGKDAMERLKTDMKAVAAYVEQVVNKTQDVSIVPKLALKTRDKSSTTNALSSIVPQSVSLREVPYTRETLELKFKSVKDAKGYGIIWAYGNNSPDSWSKQAMKVVTSARNVVLTGLESGKTIWVRVKSYNANNVESDWSDVVSRVVP